MSTNIQSLGVTACAECIGRSCVTAGCNLSCEYGSSWCNTVVSGFMKGNSKPLFTGVYGYPLYGIDERLTGKGIEEGDLLTHVNDEYIRSLDELAKATEAIDAGTTFRIRKRDGRRIEVIL